MYHVYYTTQCNFIILRTFIHMTLTSPNKKWMRFADIVRRFYHFLLWRGNFCFDVVGNFELRKILDSVKQWYLQTKKHAATSSERAHNITWYKQKRRRNRWASKQVSRRLLLHSLYSTAISLYTTAISLYTTAISLYTTAISLYTTAIFSIYYCYILHILLLYSPYTTAIFYIYYCNILHILLLYSIYTTAIFSIYYCYISLYYCYILYILLQYSPYTTAIFYIYYCYISIYYCYILYILLLYSLYTTAMSSIHYCYILYSLARFMHLRRHQSRSYRMNANRSSFNS